MAGLKPQRWANILSLVRKGFAIAGLEARRRKRASFLPEWSALLDVIEDKRIRWRLSAFGRHCSVHGSRPDQVAQSTLSDYRAHLERTDFARRPQTSTPSSASPGTKRLTRLRRGRSCV